MPANTLNEDGELSQKTKVDWSTPYDSWLLPILNRYRRGGAIECRAIPSEIQLHIDKLISTHTASREREIINTFENWRQGRPADAPRYVSFYELLDEYFGRRTDAKQLSPRKEED